MSGDKNNRLLIGLLLLFVATRVLFLLFAHPHFFFGVEELARGVLAHDIISGNKLLPLYTYQIDHYSGGSLVVGVLAAPFFWILGPSVFALKLVALLFFTVTLMIWYLIGLRYFNRTVAVLFSLLFIFAPPPFIRLSVLTMGFHTESVFFTAITILILYKILFSGTKNDRLYLVLGLFCGLGLWFAYIFGITLVCVLICWFSHDQKFLLKKGFLLFCVGFLIGFTPWIVYNFLNHFQGLFILGVPLQDIFSAPSSLSRLFPLHRSEVWQAAWYDILMSLSAGD